MAVKNQDLLRSKKTVSSVGLFAETPLSKEPLVGDIFFECNSVYCIKNE